MSKEKDDEYKVVAFKTLNDDDEAQVVLPEGFHVVQSAEHSQEMSSQKSVQSMRKITGSWSSFGDENVEQLDESEQFARLRNQLSAHHQQMSSSLSSDRRMAIAATSQVQSTQVHMQKQTHHRTSNFRQQTSNIKASVEKQEFTNLQSIDEAKEISTNPIQLKVVTSRNRIQMHHVHTVQEFRSKM